MVDELRTKLEMSLVQYSDFVRKTWNVDMEGGGTARLKPVYSINNEAVI